MDGNSGPGGRHPAPGRSRERERFAADGQRALGLNAELRAAATASVRTSLDALAGPAALWKEAALSGIPPYCPSTILRICRPIQTSSHTPASARTRMITVPSSRDMTDGRL